MTTYTYMAPSEIQYMKAVLSMLQSRGHEALYNRLKNARCEIQPSGEYSSVRWNGYATTVSFFIPMLEYAHHDFNDDDRDIVVNVCIAAMPPGAGLDVLEVTFSPLLEDVSQANSLEHELTRMSEQLADLPLGFTLPTDILDRGRKMAAVYLYLYAVENYLRLFIEHVGTMTYGPEYWAAFTVPRAVQNSITGRKQQEAKNQWISVRGDSPLFYLDFKELSDIIINNWPVFTQYFPSQAWISVKIEELGNCRNLVAHNSVVTEFEIELIRMTFKGIIRQLHPFLK